jgi:hypothetical protein
MSLPHMNWRYVGSIGFGAISVTPTVAETLDALFALATRTTYLDGTSRTPGVDSACTWTRIQISGTTESLYCETPVNALNQRIMFGGSTSTPGSIPMQSGESFSTGTILVNLIKNAGTTMPTGSNWAIPSPFGGGQVYGWGKFWPASNGYGTIYLWESKEAVAVAISNSSLTTTYATIAGAILDPETSDTITDSETDGRVYGIIRTGTSNAISQSYWSDAYSRGSSGFNMRWMHYNGSSGQTVYNGNPSAGIFSPNSAAIALMIPLTSYVENSTATTLRTRSGQFGRMSIMYRSMASDNVIGRLRDIYMFSDAQLGQRLTSGGTPVGYVLAGNGTSNVDCILLEHA